MIKKDYLGTKYFGRSSNANNARKQKKNKKKTVLQTDQQMHATLKAPKQEQDKFYRKVTN